MAQVFVKPEDSSLTAYYKRYPWAKNAADEAMAKVETTAHKPRSVGGWKRNYHPIGAGKVEGVGTEVYDQRSITQVKKKKATGGK